MPQSARAVESAAKPIDHVIRRFPLRDWQDVDAALAALLREPVDGLSVLFDRVTSGLRWNIIDAANRLHLPTIHGARHFVEDGGHHSHGIDWPALRVARADCFARILDGAKPADLPVQQPTRFELVVNRHRARKLNMAIPQSVLLQAHRGARSKRRHPPRHPSAAM